jgi:tripartite-type tricarboxylate transporter receptor subunit TctC
MSIKSIRWAQGNKSASIANEFASFIAGAKTSIDIAIYDFRLKGDDETTVVEAIKRAAKIHTVRIAYDHTKQATTKATGKGGIANDPAPPGTMEFV